MYVPARCPLVSIASPTTSHHRHPGEGRDPGTGRLALRSRGSTTALRVRRSAHMPKATACFEVHGSRPVPACSLSLASGAGMTSRSRHRDDVMDNVTVAAPEWRHGGGVGMTPW